MTSTRSTVLASEIPTIIEDPARGIVSLVGSSGGLSRIDGDIEESSLIRGSLAIETEHGVIYLEPHARVEISEETPYDDQHEWLIEWSINGFGTTARQAAAETWRTIFGRETATDEDAGVFTVTDSVTGARTSVDLSDPESGVA